MTNEESLDLVRYALDHGYRLYFEGCVFSFDRDSRLVIVKPPEYLK